MQIFKHLLIDKTKLQILRFGDCHFVPLEFPNDNDLKLEVFDNLLLKNLAEAREIHESGDVSKINVLNKSNDFLILHDGEIITGAKQNRTVDKTVILQSRQSQNIDVLCVEKGRWHSTGSTFSSHNAKLGMNIRYSKELYNENKQNTVWSEIDKLYQNHNTVSPTSDLCSLQEEINIDKSFNTEFKSKVFNKVYNGIIVKSPTISFIEIFYDYYIFENQISKSLNSLLNFQENNENSNLNLDESLNNLKQSIWLKESKDTNESSMSYSCSTKGRAVFYNHKLVHLIYYFM